jgi:nitrogen regulatory protein PII
VTWDYLAGFVDGEGCIQCRPYRVQLWQADREVLDMIQEFLALHGIRSKVVMHIKPRSKKHSQMHVLRFTTAKDMFLFLDKMIGRLVVKDGEANQAFDELCDLALDAHNGRFNAVGQGMSKRAYLQVFDVLKAM